MNSQSNVDHDVHVKEAFKLINDKLANGYKFVALHVYSTDEGAPIFWRIRLKNRNSKIILPMHISEDGKYVLKEPNFNGCKKPLYRLPDLIAIQNEPVYVVEGESCADRLVEKGLLATTSGGATSAINTDWLVLTKRNIIIWHDADTPGLQYAKNVTEILLQLNCSVSWIDIDKLNLPNGGDCVDWLNDYPEATKDDIHKLVTEIPNNITGIDNDFKSSYPRFEVKDNGIYYCEESNKSIWLCSLLIIKALTRDVDGINWGRLLEFKDADNVFRTWTMPMELLGGNGDELAKELLRLGLRITSGFSARKLIMEYIINSETNQRVRCVLKTGWHEKSFILPNKVFGQAQEAISLQSETVISTDYSISGTLEEWQTNIAMLCKNNSRLIFAVATAFAAPLLKTTGAESGGFHFRGESSVGKTTTLLVAASVWGGKSYVQNWRATDNALEGLAAQHNDTLLILDELSQIDPKFAGEVAYMLANGQGKARASKTGHARQRLIWRLLFLSSGEISLSSHMQEAGKREKAGQEVRMIDIPADAGCEKGIFEDLHSFPNGSIFSESLKIACEHYNGIASNFFLEQLVMIEPIKLLTKIHTLQDKFIEIVSASAHGQVKRVAKRFALVATAGELATELGVTGWQKGDVLEATKICFEAWLGARESGNGSSEKDSALEQVRHFFQENASRFDIFDDVENYQNTKIPNKCAGFKKCDGSFFVYPRTFKDEVCKGIGSTKDILKIIEKCGWLIPSDDKTSYKSVWVPTQSRTIRLYHFSSSIIGTRENEV